LYDRFSSGVGASLIVGRGIHLGLKIGWTRITPLGHHDKIFPARRYDVSVTAGDQIVDSQLPAVHWRLAMTASLRRTFDLRPGNEMSSSSRRVRLTASAKHNWTLGGGFNLRPKVSFHGWLGPDKDLSWGDELYLGGPETVRGYAERSLATRGYILFAVEAGYQPAARFRLFGFADLVYYRRFISDSPDRIWRRVAGYGLGLETINYLGQTRLEIGWPENAAAGDGVIYLRWLRGW
jgi:hypothetical protein